MRRLFVLLLTLIVATAAAPAPVVVEYAGSLVTPMEGPIATALARQGIAFQGEGKGSKALAHLIAAHLRRPDVFISAAREPVRELQRRGLLASVATFASATLVLGYSPRSPQLAAFRSVLAGRLSVRDLLRTPGLRIGRTDPALDPKGAYTERSLRLLGLSPALGSTFPEEDLLVRLETGVIDCGFLYSTEAIARSIPSLALPGKASLSGEITFTVAVKKDAPHPLEARRFTDFILKGEGRNILEAAGLHYRN
jgi:molybdate/tungstate transport system substrate-binding protein